MKPRKYPLASRVHYKFLRTTHTVNLGSEIVGTKHVSGKNIFWSTLTAKSKGGKFFEFLHCPFGAGLIGKLACAVWLVAQNDNAAM